jgi:hypothetical protein
MAGKSSLLASSSSGNIGSFHPYTTNKVSGFVWNFFSKIMRFKSFSFRIPTNLMNQFQQSADFYKRFPQLCPTFNDSGSIYNMVKLIKPIY